MSRLYLSVVPTNTANPTQRGVHNIIIHTGKITVGASNTTPTNFEDTRGQLSFYSVGIEGFRCRIASMYMKMPLPSTGQGLGNGDIAHYIQDYSWLVDKALQET